jgi:predicted nucleotidyltransferase
MAAIGPLAKRNKGKQIRRATADRLLADFLRRVEQVNRNEEFAFFVEEVRLFGSYLRGEEMVGDVDVAFSMMRKTMGKLSARCLAIGKHREDYERAMGEVERFLRARSRWLDFAAVENLEKHGFANKIIYQIPHRMDLMRAISKDERVVTVSHLHRIVEGT